MPHTPQTGQFQPENFITVEHAELITGSVEILDGETTTKTSIKGNGVAISGSPNDGGVLISGRDGATQRHVSVTATGAVITSPGAAVPITYAAPTFATVGVASALAVAANAARRVVILTVTTAGRRVSIGFGAAAAVLNSGITILTSQPLVIENSLLTTAAINAIADAAGTNLAIQEGT